MLYARIVTLEYDSLYSYYSIPKATIQATIGPLALDLARRSQDWERIPMAESVLVISVLSILLTAPIGAILMEKLANKLLKTDTGPGTTDAEDGAP